LDAIEEVAGMRVVEGPVAIAIAQDQGLDPRFVILESATALRYDLDLVHAGVDRPQGPAEFDLAGSAPERLTTGLECAEDREYPGGVLEDHFGRVGDRAAIVHREHPTMRGERSRSRFVQDPAHRVEVVRAPVGHLRRIEA